MIRHLLVLVTVQLTVLQAFSQNLPPRGSVPDNRPALFSRLQAGPAARASAGQPDITPILNKIFTAGNPGDQFRLPLAGDSILVKVMAKAVRNEHVTAMTFEILNFQKAWLTINKITEGDSSRFAGSAYHPKYSDGLILKSLDKRYYLDILGDQAGLITD